MCNYRHPGPRRVWEVGPKPQSMPPLPSPHVPGDEFQKRPRCCYTRDFRAREVRGPCRAMRRLRSWSGSRRSRAGESTAKSTFIRKTNVIWKSFFRVFAERSPTPYFYSVLSPSRSPSFHNFDSQLAKLHFWPKRVQWDSIGTQLDPIWTPIG